ncbi:hypothetical protein [Winogradskyella flava]|uniref:hypothetical protein n=1 Tax=Winogradskyella flava TaxID=1884876 RepID=UPI0024936E6C|nr:hypothetical protein [Winogradskyella flava]
MKKIPRIDISDEMRECAKIESKKRDAFIKHHFEVKHLSYEERDELGFIGEFACCQLLGIDWKQNIRDSYHTIDDFDVVLKGKKIDVKTETVPTAYARKILRKEILDDELYGRRLINEGQFDLLKKYDIVIFSLFAREHLDFWFPIGYLETSHIINNYPPGKARPDGGTYPFSGCPVPTSVLKPIEQLI